MMKMLPFLLAGSAFVVTSAAVAQTAPEQPAAGQEAATAEATATPPATMEADSTMTADTAVEAATPVTFTDEQIASFAAAALKIQALDKSQPATQEQLMKIVTDSGLEPETYVAINDAMAKDEEVAKRVQVAAGEITKKTAG